MGEYLLKVKIKHTGIDQVFSYWNVEKSLKVIYPYATGLFLDQLKTNVDNRHKISFVINVFVSEQSQLLLEYLRAVNQDHDAYTFRYLKTSLFNLPT